VSHIHVVGFDPSLNNWGIVHARVGLETGDILVDEMQLCETDSEKGKTVRQNSDDVRRATQLCAAMQAACAGKVVAFAEVPVGSQSARAMASYGICVGVLGSIQIPLVQVSPTEVKVAAINCKTASKEEMIAWGVHRHPEAPWLRRNGKLLTKNEHLADACAAIHAGIKTPEFQSTLRILRANMTKAPA
jgi:hypothetical protein